MKNILLNILGFLTLILTALLFPAIFIALLFFFVKKKTLLKILLITALTGSALFLGLFVYRNYFFTFGSLDAKNSQKGPGPVTSPDGKYTANAFYEPYGGAAGGVNVWVDITNTDNKKVKTVYYSDAKNNFSLDWKNDNSLTILNDDPEYPNSSRTITLKVDQEIYDENGLACRSLLMKKEYTKCYQHS
ncbi:DUF5412 domain-containing protein [Metabacillus sp. GX 13764]|uniref:DUF5412 family protein n=1 Tax=Metabacillus kandeliae TaxID=2900151 RepID=UPI001E5B4420|nr:DUF5412 family protein [Metabacillus kandeliae]MCD7032678.1 DUF5412 domain-containing protein [Metabacillus kandeliae]